MSKKNYFLWCALLATIAISGFQCSKDKNTFQLTLNWKAVVHDKPYVQYQFYTYEGVQKISFTNIGFYISNLELLKSDGSSVLLKDIDYLNFSDVQTSESAAALGISKIFSNMDEATYTGIRFGVGVRADYNTKVPGDFDISNPLSNNANYWSGWNSYIFTRTEGKLDTLGSGPGASNIDFTYHTGTDTYYRTVTLQKSINITANTTVDISYDIAKLFFNGTGYLRIQDKTTSHNPSDTALATFLMDNFAKAITTQ